MNLEELLGQIIGDHLPILLSDHHRDWEPRDLLGTLPESVLGQRVHFQPGLYIAEISEKGYLGAVLYRIKPKPVQ